MDINNLSDELKAKAKECKSRDDLLKLAKEESIELTEEELDAVAGGGLWKECPDYEPCSAYFSGK